MTDEAVVKKVKDVNRISLKYHLTHFILSASRILSS